MRRVILGSVFAGLAVWIAGFIFWGPLLGWIPYKVASEGNQVAVQQALKANLEVTGSGVYQIPSTATQTGTVLHAQGPVAQVQFVDAGFPASDTTAMLWGLLLAWLCALAFGLAMRSATAHMGFAGRMRIVIFVTGAIAGYTHLAPPVLEHAPWGYHLYALVADLVTWIAAGAVYARWFLPTANAH